MYLVARLAPLGKMAVTLSWVAALAFAQAAPSESAASFALHNLFSDAMVLQAEAPTLFGSCTPGSTLRATVGNASKVATCNPAGDWTLAFPPQPASDPNIGAGQDIVVTHEQGTEVSESVTLKDVLFGDVWVCGGQSNMEFSVAEAFGYDGQVGGLIPAAGRDGLRLFAVQKNSSSVPVDRVIDSQYSQGWVRSTPQTACGAEYNNDGYDPPSNTSAYCAPHCGPSAVVKSFSRATWGYFSAVCWATGAALLRDTGRPQGMLESCWGGTNIESWTPTAPDLDQDSIVPQSSQGAGALYNGMIAPLQKFPIKGALFYQGEANARAANQYANQMRNMIKDWRNGWVGAPATLRNFTFILHQLSAYSNDKAACAEGPSPPPAHRDPDIPALRWSQQGSVAPWTGVHGEDLPRVAMTVGIDLSDPGSPCGCVHIRNKTAVGERMALAARALAYGENVHYTGPVATKFTKVGNKLRILFSGAELPLSFRTISQTTLPTQQGVEILLQNATWLPVVATVADTSPEIVVQLPDSSNLQAVRYAWDDVPATQLLYDSAKAFGLSGLPAPPFWATCTESGCNLIPPGRLPMPSSPTPAPHPHVPTAPPAPPSTQCLFYNRTAITDATQVATGLVPFLDQDACCGMCRAFEGCVAAELMGSGHKTPPFPTSACNLYGTDGSRKPWSCSFPCARMAVIPH